jgi:hypothetical protein
MLRRAHVLENPDRPDRFHAPPPLFLFSCRAGCSTGKVDGIFEGDTVTALKDRTQIKIQLHRIDCLNRSFLESSEIEATLKFLNQASLGLKHLQKDKKSKN